MSLTQGGQTLVKLGQTRRRLDAGEARHGGEARDSSSGDQMAGGGHLRATDEPVHRME